MSRRIRVIEPVVTHDFAQHLEERAKEAIQSRDQEDSTSITSGLQREMSLALDHIERTRQLHDNLRRNLRQHELYLLTEILQREPRGSQVYRDYRLPERDRLRDRLRELDAERRRLAIWHEEHRSRLHDRLLTLFNRLTQLE